MLCQAPGTSNNNLSSGVIYQREWLCTWGAFKILSFIFFHHSSRCEKTSRYTLCCNNYHNFSSIWQNIHTLNRSTCCLSWQLTLKSSLGFGADKTKQRMFKGNILCSFPALYFYSWMLLGRFYIIRSSKQSFFILHLALVQLIRQAVLAPIPLRSILF